MKIFTKAKKLVKLALEDVLLEGKSLISLTIEMFDDLARLNNISHLVGKKVERTTDMAVAELAEIQSKQAKSTFFKMLKTYANLNILKLPANWMQTQQYKIFRRGDLVQYRGYLASILKDIQPEGEFLTKTGRKKQTTVMLNREFLLKEIEKCDIEIELIDESMRNYNADTAIAYAI